MLNLTDKELVTEYVKIAQGNIKLAREYFTEDLMREELSEEEFIMKLRKFAPIFEELLKGKAK